MSENLTNGILDAAENNDAIITEENATVDTASESLDFCPACGTELDPETGACLKCEQEAEEGEAEKSKKKGMVTMIIGIVFSALALIAFSFFAYFSLTSMLTYNPNAEGWDALGAGLGAVVAWLFSLICGACEVVLGIPGFVLSIITAVRGKKGGIKVTGIILTVLNALMTLAVVILAIINLLIISSGNG